MRVVLDGERLAGEHGDLAGAVDAGRREAERKGRVIIEVRVDGCAVAEELLRAIGSGEQTPQEPAGDEVSMTSCDPMGLVRRSFAEAASKLGEAVSLQQSAARAIQSGRLDQALPDLARVVEIWEGTRAAVSSGLRLAAMTGADAGSGAPGMEEFGPGISRLAARLGEIKRCLKAQDWSGLADVLAYELPEEAERWRGLLNEVAGRAPAKG